jgi:hypothetical protein
MEKEVKTRGIVPDVPPEFPRVLTQVTQNLERLHRKGEISDGALLVFGFSMVWKATEDLKPSERRAKFIEMGEMFLQQHGGARDGDADRGSATGPGHSTDPAEQRPVDGGRTPGDPAV